MLYQLIYSPFKAFMLRLVYWYGLSVKMLLKLNCVSGFNLYDIPSVVFVVFLWLVFVLFRGIWDRVK